MLKKLKTSLFNFCQMSYEEPGWVDVAKCGAVGTAAIGLWSAFIGAIYGAVNYWF